jgi:hypothetical protein
MTLEGARARGWPEGDAGRLLTKVSMIRERTAKETAWHVILYKVALGGLKAFIEWHEVAEATRKAKEDAKRKKERIEAARRIIEAREQLARDKVIIGSLYATSICFGSVLFTYMHTYSLNKMCTYMLNIGK